MPDELQQRETYEIAGRTLPGAPANLRRFSLNSPPRLWIEEALVDYGTPGKRLKPKSKKKSLVSGSFRTFFSRLVLTTLRAHWQETKQISFLFHEINAHVNLTQVGRIKKILMQVKAFFSGECLRRKAEIDMELDARSSTPKGKRKDTI